jgi:hypothetical protein
MEVNAASRGMIKNRDHMRQIKSFSGMRWEKITPTDIDGFIDFGGKVFVFIEAKHGESMPPYGQRLALERLCDTCKKAGLISAVLLVGHNTSGDINISECNVFRYRLDGQWRKPVKPISAAKAVSILSAMRTQKEATA